MKNGMRNKNESSPYSLVTIWKNIAIFTRSSMDFCVKNCNFPIILLKWSSLHLIHHFVSTKVKDCRSILRDVIFKFFPKSFKIITNFNSLYRSLSRIQRTFDYKASSSLLRPNVDGKCFKWFTVWSFLLFFFYLSTVFSSIFSSSSPPPATFPPVRLNVL